MTLNNKVRPHLNVPDSVSEGPNKSNGSREDFISEEYSKHDITEIIFSGAADFNG